MNTGRITEYDADSGEGSIRPHDEQRDLPFEAAGLAAGQDPADLHVGDEVRYEVTGGLAGISCVDVERTE